MLTNRVEVTNLDPSEMQSYRFVTVKRFYPITVHSSELILGTANCCAYETEEFITVFRLTNVIVATVTSIRRVALAARYNMLHILETVKSNLECIS
jgi:hypothetical protein